MVQRVYRQIREANIDANITVAASEAQKNSIINHLSEALSVNVIGSSVIGENADNLYVINKLCIPVIALGVINTIAATSPDGILVATKDASSRLSPYVDELSSSFFVASSGICTKHVDGELIP